MSAATSPTGAVDAGKAILLTLVEQIGSELVLDLIRDMVSGGGVVDLTSDLLQMGANVVAAVRAVIDPPTMNAIVMAGFVAADAEGEALRAAKFSKE